MIGGDVHPYGVCVARSRLIYVLNGGQPGASYIAVYQPGATVPFEKITSGLSNRPTSCAVDTAGDLFVSEDFALKVNIDEYPTGSTRGATLVSFSKPSKETCPGGMAFGSAGKLLVGITFYTQTNPNDGHVFRIDPSTGNATDLGLQSVDNNCDSGVGVDGKGNVYVGTPRGIAVYSPRQTVPQRTIRKGLTSWILFSVDSKGGVYVPNFAPPSQPKLAKVVEYAPGGNAPVNVIHDATYVSPFGTALTPGT